MPLIPLLLFPFPLAILLPVTYLDIIKVIP
nr:MAG TPA: hypothetical protein [Caudoviricetes sp.]